MDPWRRRILFLWIPVPVDLDLNLFGLQSLRSSPQTKKVGKLERKNVRQKK